MISHGWNVCFVIGRTGEKWGWRNNTNSWDFPGGPGQNLLSSAGDVGLIPGWGSKIPRAVAQLSQWATRRKVHMPQWRPSTAKKKKKEYKFLTYEINSWNLVVFNVPSQFYTPCHRGLWSRLWPQISDNKPHVDEGIRNRLDAETNFMRWPYPP